VIALTYIYGVGKTTSAKILEKVKIDPNTKIDDIAETDLDKVRDELKNHLVE
jgi:small subunit ribosomal protein S13